MLFAGAAVAHAQSLANRPADKEGVSTDRLAALDRRYQAGVDGGEIPGAVVMVARNGRLVHERAFGFASPADRTPMTTRTVFRLASMTKPITSVAIMQLVEQGRLILHDPIAAYLPELKDLKVSVDAPDPATGKRQLTLVAADRQPTVQDLLRHTSGFVYGQFGDGPVHKAYVEARIGASEFTTAEMITRLAKLPLAHQPATTFEYSVSTDVLGRIVEVVSGETLDQYVERHIAKPLGLGSFGFKVQPGYTLALAPNESGEGGKQVAEARARTPAFLSGGGGMYATGGDYMRFAQMLLNGGELDGVRILSPKTVALMTSNHLPPCVVYPRNMTSLLSIIAPTPEMGQGFGLGFAVRVAQGHNPLPGSVGEYYWAGISGVYFWVDPQERLIVASMTAQGRTDMRIRYRQLARSLVYQALEKSNPPLAGAADVRPAACVAPGRR